MSTFDLVIKGGTVIDGLRTPRYKADIGIAGGRVVRIGRIDAAAGREVVDASHRVVAPGFVDLHTHTARCSGIRGAPCRGGTG
jgi:N-acyl-D-amino-acid deacylase